MALLQAGSSYHSSLQPLPEKDLHEWLLHSPQQQKALLFRCSAASGLALTVCFSNPPKATEITLALWTSSPLTQTKHTSVTL